MEKIYEKLDDLHVVARTIYKKSGDSYAYSDSACTKKVNQADLYDLFVKGVIIVDTSKYYHAASYSVSSNVGTITYIKTDTTTATTAVLATLLSSES
jgi:hypothetical protein